ncbi:MAG: Gfo/Idh/MocA family oxidoreductase, partial [Bacteroidota bacterium]
MKNDPFQWGILGLGKIARKFAQDLTAIKDAKLVAVGSRSIERAQAFANDFGVTYAAGSYEDLFNGPRIDAVYIATPHVQHHALALLCMDYGVAVLCEKPMGLNFSEVEEMVRTAREKQVYLMEALWSRFTPSTKKVLDIINSGTIGKVEGVRADFGFQLGPNSGKRISDP